MPLHHMSVGQASEGSCATHGVRSHTLATQPVQNHDEVARDEREGSSNYVWREPCLLSLCVAQACSHVWDFCAPTLCAKALRRLLLLLSRSCLVQLRVVCKTLLLIG